MSLRCLFGLLHLAVVFAAMSPARQNLMKLQKPADTAQICGGTNCIVEPPSANHSALESREERCECCWRDCDFDQLEEKEFLVLAKSLAGRGEDYADVDAWLIMCNGKMQVELNMYTPILETVRIGVESIGAKVRTIANSATDDMNTMLAAVRATVAAGRRPMVFAVGYWYAHDQGLVYERLRHVSEAGAYLILYQTEQFREGHYLKWSQDTATKVNAHEVWEYSMANFVHYPSRDDFLVRYVPPGYVPSMDVGVDINSPLKQQGLVGYMGDVGKQMVKDYVGQFKGRLILSNKIWTTEQVRWWLETYPLQLNQHKAQTCCPREEWEAEWMHVESFRMSVLFSNKACVISAPSADVEMEHWAGLVNFVEFPDTARKAKELWANLDQCRMRSYETYKRDYAPQLLLQKSGFFNVWSPRMPAK